MNDLLTGNIISAAYNVYNTLGFGFLEKVNENSLAIELSKSKLTIVQQSPLTVFTAIIARRAVDRFLFF